MDFRVRLRQQAIDIESQLSDREADDALERAIALAANGDIAEAGELLSDEFGTVCETHAPEPVRTDAGHLAACHLIDIG